MLPMATGASPSALLAPGDPPLSRAADECTPPWVLSLQLSPTGDASGRFVRRRPVTALRSLGLVLAESLV
jgi:hypothetical protein